MRASKNTIKLQLLVWVLLLATSFLAQTACGPQRARKPTLDEAIQKGEFRTLRVGGQFDKSKVRALFRSVELEADDLPDRLIYVLDRTGPKPNIQIFRLDHGLALVVNQGKIAMLSFPLAFQDIAPHTELATSDGLMKPGASERDVTTYLKTNKIQFRVVDDEGIFVRQGKATRAEYRNYVIDGTKVIIKVIDGSLFALLLCDDEMFARLAESPQRLDVSLAPQRFWVEASLMAARLTFYRQPVCLPSSKKDCLRSTVRLIARIGNDGFVRRLGVVEGSAPLLHVALDAVHQWRYEPYLIDRKAVQVEIAVWVKFLTE